MPDRVNGPNKDLEALEQTSSTAPKDKVGWVNRVGPKALAVRLVLAAAGFALAVYNAFDGRWLSVFWVMFFVGLALARPILNLVVERASFVDDSPYRSELLLIECLTAAFAVLGIATLLGLIGRHRQGGWLGLVAAASGLALALRVRRKGKEYIENDRRERIARGGFTGWLVRRQRW